MDQKAQERSEATALILDPNLLSETGKQRQHGAMSLAGPEHYGHKVSNGCLEDMDGMHVKPNRLPIHQIMRHKNGNKHNLSHGTIVTRNHVADMSEADWLVDMWVGVLDV
jgi:hypothetical protein